MKMLIVENDFSSVLNFSKEAKKHKWVCSDYAPCLPAETGELHRFLSTVCEERPDVVIIDIALDSDEEARIDDTSLEHIPVSTDMFSGFAYCQALVRERWNIPIVFLTQIESGNVTRAAIKAGADLVLVKKTLAGDFVKEVTTLVRSRAAHDPEFFWQLSDALSASAEMWQSGTMEKALNRFFLNQSIAQRFGLFTASLRGVLGPLFQGDMEAEKKLMLSLVRSQVLLSLVDPKLRDHVKHTGNVFWMGYRLLHEIQEFQEPDSLSGHLLGLYDLSGQLTPRDQLFYSWTLAALFHDFAYMDERQDQLVGLVSSLLKTGRVELSSIRDEASWERNIPELRSFVERIAGRDHFLYNFIETVYSGFGSKKQRKDVKKAESTALIDHGFLSAHRLLDAIPLERLDPQRKNIVLHAALAIAYHNYSDMLRKWKFEPKCSGKLSVGTFPVCSLLAFCDSVQTWDRESDPLITRAEAYDGLLERLVLSDTAYVSGSEICEFSTNRRMDGTAYDVKLRIRYFVEATGGVQEVCENLGDDIQRWIDSGRLQDVCDMTGLSSLVHGQIVYELPMLLKPRTAYFGAVDPGNDI